MNPHGHTQKCFYPEILNVVRLTVRLGTTLFCLLDFLSIFSTIVILGCATTSVFCKMKLREESNISIDGFI